MTIRIIRNIINAVGGLLVSWCATGVMTAQVPNSDLAWPTPKNEYRPGTYWWWPGSAVDRETLTWNLEQMNDAGIGTAHIIPIYGVKGAENRFIEYLSPRWVEMLDYTVREGERLCMQIDMTTGSGWPFGGPMVGEKDADAIVAYENGQFVSRPSGFQVKRSAPGNEGPALNPYSLPSLQRYLEYFDRAFSRTALKMPRAQYHDSFENSGNWCAEFFTEFRNRRGYDIRNYAAALFGEGDADIVARVKSDYRETLSDLHLAYIERWTAWAHGHGCITRNQAHGAPANLLDLYATVNIPETETFGSTSFPIPGLRRRYDTYRHTGVSFPMINRMASSAAHITGRQLVASETHTWLRDHFRTALSQMKPELDQLFANGINHVFFHGTCYSPRDAAWPGWLFYASTEVNPRNAIWQDLPEVNKYIARCQSILQSGTPANDILLYWPVYDIWHNPQGMQQQLTVHHTQWLQDFACGKIAESLKNRGYTFDFISDRQIGELTAAGGSLMSHGSTYQVILVPRLGHMPVATLNALLALARNGGVILLHDEVPDNVPGLHQYERRREQLRVLLRGLDWQVSGGVRRAQVGKGCFLNSEDLSTLLHNAGIKREPVADGLVQFIRRRHREGYQYFLANLGDRLIDGWLGFATEFAAAVLLDPLTGGGGVAATRNRNGESQVYLQLQPGESMILKTFNGRQAEGTAWRYVEPAGATVDITGTWEVTFLQGGPTLPQAFLASMLGSWAHRDDPEAQRFAGTARYSIRFNLPESAANDWLLDLGEVRESARLQINGRDAGTCWSLPFTAKIGAYLQPGANLLEIDVTNLSANRIRDLDQRQVPWKIFYDINIVNHEYKPFDASGWEIEPSGLLGPVRLVPLRTLQVD